LGCNARRCDVSNETECHVWVGLLTKPQGGRVSVYPCSKYTIKYTIHKCELVACMRPTIPPRLRMLDAPKIAASNESLAAGASPPRVPEQISSQPLPSIVSSGYPGGCATPRWQAIAMSSPLSPPGTVVNRVLAYRSAAGAPTSAASHGSPAMGRGARKQAPCWERRERRGRTELGDNPSLRAGPEASPLPFEYL